MANLSVLSYDTDSNLSQDTTLEDTMLLENVNNYSNVGNDTLLDLPLDMQFTDGNRMAIAMYLALMLFSATGNIYVFCSIMRLRDKRGKLGRINLLLLNLALADLVVTFIMMPLEIGWNFTVSWRAGDLACRLLSFFRVFGLYLSGFVLVCICLDRYIAVMKPFYICDGESRNRKMLGGAWIASIVCSLPQSFIFHVETHPKFEWYQQCITFNMFPSREYEVAYNMFGFCLMYALPMLTILFCYSRILYKIYSIAKAKRDENDMRRSSCAFLQRAKSKTLKMTLITALVFCVCWTPYNVICLWHWFDKTSALQLDQRLQKALFVFACTNSCFNPLIYGWYHLCGGQRGNSELTSHQNHHFVQAKRTPRILENGVQYLQRQPYQMDSTPEKDGSKVRFIRNSRTSPTPIPTPQVVRISTILPENILEKWDVPPNELCKGKLQLNTSSF